MRKFIVLAVGIAIGAGVLSACSGAGSPSNPVLTSNPNAPKSVSGSQLAAVSSAAAAASAQSEQQGTIDLSPNWKEMKKIIGGHGKGDWDGTCFSFACTANDPLDNSLITAGWVGVPGQQSISVSYVATDPSDDAGAQLDLGHFALFFSTDTGEQFDFQQAVTDAIDAIAVGGSKTTDFPPLQITVQHPTAAKWQFKVEQSAP